MRNVEAISWEIQILKPYPNSKPEALKILYIVLHACMYDKDLFYCAYWDYSMPIWSISGTHLVMNFYSNAYVLRSMFLKAMFLKIMFFKVIFG